MASKKVDEIIKFILEAPGFFDKNGKIPPWSSDLWNVASDTLNLNKKENEKQ